ncbi:MAG: DUF1007 family protein [Spirochaetales bacterium]|nr:DUF1007 family protein [Spirochaetales bacterium]
MLRFFLACICILLPTFVGAHPHMLLLTRLDFDFSGDRCVGVSVDWGFDMYFSQSVIDDFDINGDGTFDDEETREVYSFAFSNLKQYGYFIYLRKGDRRIQPERVTDFSVRQKNGQVFYTFYVPLEDPAFFPEFSVSVFDPTYFCAVRYQEVPASVPPEQTGEIGFELTENRRYPVYYDPLGGVDDSGSYDTWRPGLETAYPEEVRVYFR